MSSSRTPLAVEARHDAPVARLRRLVESEETPLVADPPADAPGSAPAAREEEATGGEDPALGTRPPLDESRMVDLPEWVASTPARGSGPWHGLASRFALGRAGGTALLAAVLVLAGFALAHLLRSQPGEVEAPDLPGLAEAAGDAGAAAPTEGPPQASAAPRPGSETPAATQGAVVVSVVGLVRTPGLVHLGSGARVADALGAAGGTLDNADTRTLNLARLVADGEQIVVGVAPGGDAPTGSQILAAGGGAAPADPGPGAAGAPGAAAPPGSGGAGGGGGLVDLNTATAAELEGLSGVGPATSGAIIDYRTAHGPFTAVEQLEEVRGIGPAKLAALKDQVTV